MPRFDDEISEIVEVTSSIRLEDIAEPEELENLLDWTDDATATMPAIVRPLPALRALPPPPAWSTPPPPSSVPRLGPPPRRASISSVPPPPSGVLPPPSPLPPPPSLPPISTPVPIASPALYVPPAPRFDSSPPRRTSSNPPPRASAKPPPVRVPSAGEATISVEAVPPRSLAQPTMILPRVSIPLPRISKRAVRDIATGIAGVIALALLTAMGAVVARDISARRPAAPEVAVPPARIVVTVAGPGATLVPQASIFVDGKELCRSAPCTIEPLEKGVHFVKVVAPGFNEAAARAITLSPSELRTVHFDLTRTTEAVAPVAPAAPAGPISPSELPTEPVSETPVATVTAAAPRERAVARAAPAATSGTLILTSNPPSSVVVDGHPLGITPQSTSVSAGAHSVLFVHPDFGRAARRVVVPAGRSQSVGVNFGG